MGWGEWVGGRSGSTSAVKWCGCGADGTVQLKPETILPPSIHPIPPVLPNNPPPQHHPSSLNFSIFPSGLETELRETDVGWRWRWGADSRHPISSTCNQHMQMNRHVVSQALGPGNGGIAGGVEPEGGVGGGGWGQSEN